MFSASSRNFPRAAALTLALAWTVVGFGLAPVAVKAEEVDKSFEIAFSSSGIVTYGEATLTEAELDSFLQTVPEEERTQFVSSPRRIADTIEKLMTDLLVANEAMKTDLVDDRLLNAGVYRNIMEYVSSAHLDRVVSERLLDDYSQRAREIYLTEKGRFRREPGFSFTHLLISTADRDETEAMKTILELHERVQSGADFEALVAEHSEDQAAAARGGSYSDVPPDNLDRNFSRTLRQLEQPGAISGPVRTRFGWHLIRLDGVTEPEPKSWEEARDEAIALARQRHANSIRREYTEQLKSGHSVESMPGLIEEFQKRHGYSPEMLDQGNTQD